MKTDDPVVTSIVAEKKFYDLSEDKVTVYEDKQLPTSDFESVAKTDNESAAEQDNSVAELIQTLDDPSNESTYRVDIAKTLIKSGTKEGVLSVLKTILSAYVQEEYVFKENLMQIFADVNSVEAADMLTDVLTGKISLSSDIPEIPSDIALLSDSWKYFSAIAVKSAARILFFHE